MTTTTHSKNEVASQRSLRIGSSRDIVWADRFWSGEFAEHLTRFPKSAPVGDEVTALLVASSVGAPSGTANTNVIGQVRSVKPNTESMRLHEDTHPWVMVDEPGIAVNGWTVSDVVLPGERVWVPGEGVYTVGSVVRDGIVATRINFGNGRTSRVWFRTTTVQVAADVDAGDVVVAERVPYMERYDGMVVTVEDVESSRRIRFMSENSGGLLYCDEWIKVQEKGASTPEPGTLVRATAFLPGAEPDWMDWAKHTVFTVEGPSREGGSAIKVTPRSHFPDDEGTAIIIGYQIIGHKDSKHVEKQRSTPVKAEPVIEDAPVVERGAEYDAIVRERDALLKKYDDLITALHEEAQERSWCSEFETFCEENGIPAREVEYDVTVNMTTTLDVHRLDVILGDTLNTNGREVDVREEVEVTHRADIRVTSTRERLSSGDADDEITAVLRGLGYEFDEFDVAEYDLA